MELINGELVISLLKINEVIICKRCLRKIVPYETTWVLAEPGQFERNIHRCQGVLSEHEPYNDSPDTIEKRRIRMVELLKALFWLIVAYLLLATLFNWWPINTLGWPW